MTHFTGGETETKMIYDLRQSKDLNLGVLAANSMLLYSSTAHSQAIMLSLLFGDDNELKNIHKRSNE